MITFNARCCCFHIQSPLGLLLPPPSHYLAWFTVPLAISEIATEPPPTHPQFLKELWERRKGSRTHPKVFILGCCGSQET